MTFGLFTHKKRITLGLECLKTVRTVMVTTKGIAPGEYEWTAQNYVKLNDLFVG